MDNELKIPQHVAIILDGNGRWAKAKGKPRNYGHMQGAKTVEDMCEIAYNLGVKYLTVYAFSTENWSRPDDEVERSFSLAKRCFGLGLIRTKLDTTTRSSIALSILAMNVDRLAAYYFAELLISIFQCAIRNICDIQGKYRFRTA